MGVTNHECRVKEFKEFITASRPFDLRPILPLRLSYMLRIANCDETDLD